MFETDGAEMRPFRVERPVDNDTVISMLPRQHAKQLLASVMHRLQAHTAKQGSDVSISSFTSTPVPCPHVFGKYGIEEEVSSVVTQGGIRRHRPEDNKFGQ